MTHIFYLRSSCLSFPRHVSPQQTPWESLLSSSTKKATFIKITTRITLVKDTIIALLVRILLCFCHLSFSHSNTLTLHPLLLLDLIAPIADTCSSLSAYVAFLSKCLLQQTPYMHYFICVPIPLWLHQTNTLVVCFTNYRIAARSLFSGFPTFCRSWYL